MSKKSLPILYSKLLSNRAQHQNFIQCSGLIIIMVQKTLVWNLWYDLIQHKNTSSFRSFHGGIKSSVIVNVWILLIIIKVIATKGFLKYRHNEN